MPSLEEILKKTKAKSEQVKIVRKPVSIASDDRPYPTHDEKMQETVIEEKPFEVQQPEKIIHAVVITPLPLSSPLKSSEASITEHIKTGNKVATNRQQSGSKLVANREQTGSKVVANREQTGSATGSKVVANREQTGSATGSKVVAKITFSELVGLQQEIIVFICHECKKSRSKITEALTLEYIAKSLKRSAGAVKNAIGRLEKKSCLIRIGFKNGRGGWSRYEVPDNIYHDVIRIETGSKLVANREQSGSKVVAQPVANVSCSSSINNIKTTTTRISDEWNFDILPYARFGFTKTQIQQLANSGVISAIDVQQSLIEFSYDLENNALPSIKTTKINFLMGLLWKGQSYVSEGFKNEQESMILEMARRNALKRENLLKAKFEAWESSLGSEDRKKILAKLPTSLMVLEKTYGINSQEIRNWYFNYFMQNVRITGDIQ